LSQSGQFAVFTDAFAQQFTIFFCDHDWLLSQSATRRIAQILLAIILFLPLHEKMLRKVSG
jgi:hypothetical protein